MFSSDLFDIKKNNNDECEQNKSITCLEVVDVPTCEYRWVDDKNKTVSNSRQLQLNGNIALSDTYTCIADCNVRQKHCSLMKNIVKPCRISGGKTIKFIQQLYFNVLMLVEV